MSRSESNLKLFRKFLVIFLSELKQDSFVCPNCASNSEDIIRGIEDDALLYFCKVSKKMKIKDAVEESIRHACSQSLFKPAAVSFANSFCEPLAIEDYCNKDCPMTGSLKARKTFEEYLSKAIDSVYIKVYVKPSPLAKMLFSKFAK